MSLHDDIQPGEKNVLCDGCRSNHVHLGKDSFDVDPRLSKRLDGWVQVDSRNYDLCPDCVQILVEEGCPGVE